MPENEQNDAWEQLAGKRERTQFVFYGYRHAGNGEVGGNYYKQAHSLDEAIKDLNANEGVQGEHHIVLDAFIQMEEDNDPWLHVQVMDADDVSAIVRERAGE